MTVTLTCAFNCQDVNKVLSNESQGSLSAQNVYVYCDDNDITVKPVTIGNENIMLMLQWNLISYFK